MHEPCEGFQPTGCAATVRHPGSGMDASHKFISNSICQFFLYFKIGKIELVDRSLISMTEKIPRFRKTRLSSFYDQCGLKIHLLEKSCCGYERLLDLNPPSPLPGKTVDLAPIFFFSFFFFSSFSFCAVSLCTLGLEPQKPQNPKSPKS